MQTVTVHLISYFPYKYYLDFNYNSDILHDRLHSKSHRFTNHNEQFDIQVAGKASYKKIHSTAMITLRFSYLARIFSQTALFPVPCSASPRVHWSLEDRTSRCLAPAACSPSRCRHASVVSPSAPAAWSRPNPPWSRNTQIVHQTSYINVVKKSLPLSLYSSYMYKK